MTEINRGWSKFRERGSVSGILCDLVVTDKDHIVAKELVWWNFQVQWGGTLTNTARTVVVRTMARAEVAEEVT